MRSSRSYQRCETPRSGGRSRRSPSDRARSDDPGVLGTIARTRRPLPAVGRPPTCRRRLSAQSGRGGQPCLIARVGRSGSGDSCPRLEEARRHQCAISTRIGDPDVAQERAIVVAIASLALEEDSLPVDELRVGRRRFSREARLRLRRLSCRGTARSRVRRRS